MSYLYVLQFNIALIITNNIAMIVNHPNFSFADSMDSLSSIETEDILTMHLQEILRGLCSRNLVPILKLMTM